MRHSNNFPTFSFNMTYYRSMKRDSGSWWIGMLITGKVDSKLVLNILNEIKVHCIFSPTVLHKKFICTERCRNIEKVYWDYWHSNNNVALKIISKDFIRFQSVLMNLHFNYHPRWQLSDNQSVRSSVPVVSRWLWPGNRTFSEVASMVVTWWIVAFFCTVFPPFPICNIINTDYWKSLAHSGFSGLSSPYWLLHQFILIPAERYWQN